MITFPGRTGARLFVAEDVDMRIDARDPRASYVYQFVVDKRPVFAYHRHEGHDAADHRHDYAANKTTVRTAATAALREVLEEAQAHLAGDLPRGRFPKPRGFGT